MQAGWSGLRNPVEGEREVTLQNPLRRRRTVLAAAALAVAAAAVGPFDRRAQQVVAFVNGQPITRSTSSTAPNSFS